MTQMPLSAPAPVPASRLAPRNAALPMAVIAAVLLVACARPATDVQVPTMSMHEALQRARAEPPADADLPALLLRPDALQLPSDAPHALLSAPQVRMAYLYDWIDPEGNKHFGEWVAIPVGGLDWIMNDGTRAPLDAPPRDAAGPADDN